MYNRFESDRGAQMLSHWMPYGLGPRQCIGMRFAQIEMKACIVNLLRRFEIRPANASEAKPLDELPSEAPIDVRAMIENRDALVNPIAGIHSGPTLSPEGGVHVVLVARTTRQVDGVVSDTACPTLVSDTVNSAFVQNINVALEVRKPIELSEEENAIAFERSINRIAMSESLYSELHRRIH